MHFFELIDREFSRQMADYLPKEAFKPGDYLLFTLPGVNRMLLITSSDKLGEVVDGLCIGRQCRRLSKKHMRNIASEYRHLTVEPVVGNIELWRNVSGVI